MWTPLFILFSTLLILSMAKIMFSSVIKISPKTLDNNSPNKNFKISWKW